MKFLWPTLILFFILLAPAIFAKQAGFLIDYSLSPYASATTFIGINRALAAGEDMALEKNPLTIKNGWQIAVRAGELLLVWVPINYFSMLIQHEFFGHATTYYHFGGQPLFAFKEKVFNLPPPYGKGVIGVSGLVKEWSFAKRHIVNLSGVAAGDIFAERLALDWAESNTLEGRLGFLYLFNSQQTLGYTLLKHVIDFGQGNDVLHYQQTLNNFFKGDNPNAKDTLSDLHLNLAVLVNALDPLSYFSFYAIYEYAKSKREVAFPWLRLSEEVAYLPVPRGVLSPFGPEFYLNNYLQLFGRTLRVYGHFGILASNVYGGGGIEGDAWNSRDFSLGGHVEVFGQPTIDLKANIEFADQGKGPFVRADRIFGRSLVGALGLVKLRYRFAGPFALNLETGYKSQGYVPGLTIADSFILRAGASMQF